MRTPNFKLDWFVPNQVAALTHFHADVTTEDFMGVVQTGQALLAHAEQEFHVLIDNRVMEMEAPVGLSQMKDMVPYMNHPFLRWVVVVKPESLPLDTAGLPIEEAGQIRLKNVSTLADAVGFLRKMTLDINWQQADTTFFPNVAGNDYLKDKD